MRHTTVAAMGLLGACGLALLLVPALPAPADPGVAPPQPYAGVIQALERWLAHEVPAKGLPTLSVALVDDQAIVWAHGFGHTDREANSLAGPTTVYRVGSVSKPFT